MSFLPYRIPNIDRKTHLLLDPHVIIIGAGASKAACTVDANGKTVPLLRNIHEALELTDSLKDYGFSEKELADFELLYSNVYGKAEFRDLQKNLEKRISNYFSELMLPDEVTLYDYLVLSLTGKDAIISFNWDPFLLQAYRRNICVGNLPQLFFPHGNVGVGLCMECLNKGYANCICPDCGKPFVDMPLLFPVGRKNYYDGSIIENEWNGAKNALKHAAGITIWGYSAPVTDEEAFRLLTESFAESQLQEIAPVTIINLEKNRTGQLERWKDIYSERMISYCEDFRKSLLWQWPRVSLEAIFDAILQMHPRHNDKPFKEFKDLIELQNFAQTIDEFEIHY